MPRLTLRRNGVLIKTKFAPGETESQSAEIIINSPEVKYDFGFPRRSGECQSANVFSKTDRMGFIIFSGLRIDIFLCLAPGGKPWIHAAYLIGYLEIIY